MKKLVLLTVTALFALNLTAFAETSPADQKWLAAVEKIVAKGDTKVSTPSEARVNLHKAWGKQKGYSVKVAKTEAGYHIEVTKLLAQR